MKGIKRLADKKYFMTIVWIFLIIAIWEVFAFYVAATKRTPENILPHLSGIIESVVSKKTINGGQTPFVLRGNGSSPGLSTNLPQRGSRDTSSIGENDHCIPSTAASSAMQLYAFSASSGLKVAARASGTGITVL